MSAEPKKTKRRGDTIDAVICLDDGVYLRYRAILRHLCVGLIDAISTVRLVTTSPDAQALNLGPVQTILHPELRWPMKARRHRALVEALSDRPPTVIHAMSAESYEVAEKLAAEFDADLIYQTTAVHDVAALPVPSGNNEQRVICASQPLVNHCASQPNSARRVISLIRPGVVCADEPTCFRDPSREPTLLSTASLTEDGGVETLLHAVHILRQRGRHFLTFLLGYGPEEPKLRRTAQTLGLGSVVVFAQPEGDAMRAMVGADLFVQPAVEHAISARSLQALAQGMAVVGVAGGVHDAYVPDKTALVMETSTAPNLADGIEALLLDRARARELASNAIAYMRANHTMSAMAELTAETYREAALRQATFPLNG